MIYSPSQDKFYAEELKDEYIASKSWPEDGVEISKEVFQEFSYNDSPHTKERAYIEGSFLWLAKEVDAPSEEFLSQLERIWRDNELTRADSELNKVQDGDSKAVGSVAQWREYRKLLRSWPEAGDFPDSSKRPAAPDIK